MRAFSVFVVAFALIVVSQSSVSAHAVTFYHGSDFSAISSTHKYIAVCDKESDDDGYFVDVMLNDGDWWRILDFNGSQSGCGSMTFSRPIVTIIQCELTNHITGAKSCYGAQGVS